MQQSHFVFGYGSLMNIVNLEKYLGRNLIESQQLKDFTFCSLHGFCRCWNVAMDNSIDLPQYKYYIDRKTNTRPRNFVTFLNIRPHRDKTIFGILFRVSQLELQNLDLRERNYQRIDVTDKSDLTIEGTVWTYIGIKAAENRYQTGLKRGNAVIALDYINSVTDAYRSLGKEAVTNYIATTDKPLVPIVDLAKCLLLPK